MKTILASVVALAIALPVFAMNLNVDSGLAKGEMVSAFHPTHIAGPMKGTDKCFPCTYGNLPAVQAWVNGDDMGNVAKMAESLQMNVKEHAGAKFKALMVVLTDDKEAVKGKLVNIMEKHNINDVHVALLSPSDDAVKAYKINTDKEVKNTVLVYKNRTITDKFVNLKLDDKGCGSLCGAISGLLK